MGLLADAQQFVQCDGQVYALGNWPDELRIDRDFLLAADSRYVHHYGMRVNFNVTNGHACYQINRDDSTQPYVVANLVGSHWTPMPQKARNHTKPV